MTNEIDRLIQGYKKFREKYFNGPAHTEFDELVRSGQSPKILIIACSDSRVDPAIVTNSKPGDLFVIRNVANLVPPYEDDNSYHGTSAALEFGVCNLEVDHIIVFGHSQCGGIDALMRNPNNNIMSKKGFISKWMQLAKDAYDIVLEKYPDASFYEKTLLCGEYSLINSFKNLSTFPWIAERVNAGNLRLHAWYFDLETGIIHNFDPEKNAFKTLD